MRSVRLICVSLLIFAAVSNTAYGYRILGVFPTVSKSHFIIGDALMRNLADKGHYVTVISPYPMTDREYRGIEVPTLIPAWNEIVKDFLDMRDQSLFESILQVFDIGVITTNLTLNDPTVQKLMSSNEKFDVIIMDLFVNEAHFGFGELFNAPVIATGLFGALSWNTDLVGTPSPPSYVPNPFSELTTHMSLLERILNQAVLTFEKVFFDNSYFPRQEELFKQYFPNSKKSLDNLRKNTALVLLNQHVSLSFPRPYMPNMIEVGGLHINRNRKPLPVDLQKFLDEAKDGAIYFSMGSNLKSKNLPAEKRDALLRTFKSLKQRVLWKFEATNLPGKSENVYISEWFPQDDILAHPNVKLFITHGGLLSTTESIYHGKPIVGIPMFGDQFLNMAHAEAHGFGITVDYNTLSENSLKSAITEMLENPKYTKLIQDMSARFRDQPLEPMELATYWVEYIARHKGAPHLHSAGQELNFIEYHNLDAMLLLYGGILLLVYLLVRLAIKVVFHSVGILKKKSKLKAY